MKALAAMSDTFLKITLFLPSFSSLQTFPYATPLSPSKSWPFFPLIIIVYIYVYL